MVDGVKIGDIVSTEGVIHSADSKELIGTEEEKYVADQNFLDADMVIIRSKPMSENLGEKTPFMCYGIFGNTIVQASVNKQSITAGTLNKKVVWAYRKPYILNGDLI